MASKTAAGVRSGVFRQDRARQKRHLCAGRVRTALGIPVPRPSASRPRQAASRRSRKSADRAARIKAGQHEEADRTDPGRPGGVRRRVRPSPPPRPLDGPLAAARRPGSAFVRRLDHDQDDPPLAGREIWPSMDEGGQIRVRFGAKECAKSLRVLRNPWAFRVRITGLSIRRFPSGARAPEARRLGRLRPDGFGHTPPVPPPPPISHQPPPDRLKAV